MFQGGRLVAKMVPWLSPMLNSSVTVWTGSRWPPSSWAWTRGSPAVWRSDCYHKWRSGEISWPRDAELASPIGHRLLSCKVDLFDKNSDRYKNWQNCSFVPALYNFLWILFTFNVNCPKVPSLEIFLLPFHSTWQREFSLYGKTRVMANLLISKIPTHYRSKKEQRTITSKKQIIAKSKAPGASPEM